MTEKNPAGAKCIFCKSAMMTFDNIAAIMQSNHVTMEFRK
ncbi:Hypothetical protein ABZS17G119_00766 [Kosakonia cowanii]